ncbi:MAG: endonuclease/exonuclease/phosphatase family protein [Elusimicrobiaceae bacterium]|nr:endonuclease/exonuclease/phosphatase family protein [Elusimicrobiaceae bacterium]
MFIKKPPRHEVLASYGSAPGRRLPRRITVTVWNCHKCRHPRWERDFAELDQQSDLVMLQELRLSPAVETLLSLPCAAWRMATSFFSPGRGHACGVATGSACAAARVFFLAQEREPVINTHKMMLATVYPIPGGYLLALNVHGINFTRPAAFARQMEQAGRALAEFKGPVIMAGDFNCWSRRRRDILYSVTRVAGLTELAFKPDTRSRHPIHPVDHIFSRGLKIISAQALDGVNSSDHKPLSARFEIEET